MLELTPTLAKIERNEPVTEQELFDQAASVVLKQGKPSLNEEMLPNGKVLIGPCMYRGPNNTACNAGACIPDSVYVKDMDFRKFDDGTFSDTPGLNIDMLISLDLLPKSLRPHWGFLCSLQRAHDNASLSCFVSDYTLRMRQVACDHGLNTQALPALSDN